MAGGKFHEWKGRKQSETTGYPFDNGPPFKTPVTGNPTTGVFPVEATPVFRAGPTVTGAAPLGSVLTVAATGEPANATKTYRWFRQTGQAEPVVIAGATAATYTTAAPVAAGDKVTCEVTLTANGLSGKAVSNAITVTA